MVEVFLLRVVALLSSTCWPTGPFCGLGGGGGDDDDDDDDDEPTTTATTTIATTSTTTQPKDGNHVVFLFVLKQRKGAYGRRKPTSGSTQSPSSHHSGIRPGFP